MWSPRCGQPGPWGHGPWPRGPKKVDFLKVLKRKIIRGGPRIARMRPSRRVSMDGVPAAPRQNSGKKQIFEKTSKSPKTDQKPGKPLAPISLAGPYVHKLLHNQKISQVFPPKNAKILAVLPELLSALRQGLWFCYLQCVRRM